VNASLPLVSIVMPIRNEAATIGEALDAIAAQTYPADRIEIVIVDGQSTDGTAAVVTRRMRNDSRIKLIRGNYNCPAAMNVGIAESVGTIVAKIDGHGYMNRGFLEIGVRYLIDHPECSCVGGAIVPIGQTPTAQSNMYARFSRFGVGSGVYTSPRTVHEADTVQCGVYVKPHLEQVGAFDPDLQFGEDEEANHRLVRAGFRIVFHPGMEFHYYVRPSFRSLFRQYHNYGAARVKVLRKHPDFFRIKHVVPAAAIVALALGAAAMASPELRAPSFGVLSAYVSFVTIGAIWTGVKCHFYRFHYLFVSFLMLHFGYGLGMLREVCRLGHSEARV
jgi:glycosyltransferase involved in cell wall biosynthesis